MTKKMHAGRGRRGDDLAGWLDKMEKSGRITPDEAGRLRTAEPEAFEEAARQIRLRHASAWVGSRVDSGRLTRDEADAILDRIARGEDPDLGRDLRRAPGPPRRAVGGSSGGTEVGDGLPSH